MSPSPRGAAAGRAGIPIGLLLALASACGGGLDGAPTSPEAAPPERPATAAELALEPAPGGELASYERFRLSNEGERALRTSRTGAYGGSLQRLGVDGRWRPLLDRAGCATVAWEDLPLPPGEALHVTELPPTGARRPLLPGRYRFVVRVFSEGPASEAGSPRARVEVERRFEVAAPPEAARRRLAELFADPAVAQCGLRERLIERLIRSLGPERGLAWAREQLREDEDLRIALRVLIRAPSAGLLFAEEIEAGSARLGDLAAEHLAPLCTFTAGTCDRVLSRLDARLRREGPREGGPEASLVDALGDLQDRWSPALFERVAGLWTRPLAPETREAVELRIRARLEAEGGRARVAALHEPLLRYARSLPDPDERRERERFVLSVGCQSGAVPEERCLSLEDAVIGEAPMHAMGVGGWSEECAAFAGELRALEEAPPAIEFAPRSRVLRCDAEGLSQDPFSTGQGECGAPNEALDAL